MTEAENIYFEDMDEETPAADTTEAFVVDSDPKAEWCIRKIAEIDAETERWKRFYTERMKAIEDSNRFRIAHIKQKLIPYLQQVPLKDTKTTQKYSLPSGDLIIKKEHTKVEHDDEKLLEWLKQNASEYIRTKESVDWRTLKDQLFESDGEFFLTDTGEKVPGISETIVPAEFEVKPKVTAP